MAYWLAAARNGQDSAFIQRFDPRFWTLNFPRPMMAALTNPAPDALHVDLAFHRHDDLAGLIWASEDGKDHPLTAYETRRDYRHCELQFRWRSSGVMPLDAVNGPVLTIEGRDESGTPCTWYVRLWNYANGGPQDAQITLKFSDLQAGFLLPQEGMPVFAGDIDRMFLSLVPASFDPAGAAMIAPMDAWVELTGLACDGAQAVLPIGDIMAPIHGLSMATAYDDQYDVSPARVLRNLRLLGYRGPINHYVGMSHYFALERGGAGWLVDAQATEPLNGPCRAWHAEFLARAMEAGQDVILSLSFELFDAHCPEDWKQRDAAGNPALTGWIPPSALLSPANQAAMAWLQSVARSFVQLALAAGQPVRFQIGEPWWWTTADGRICLYDDAARAALGGNPVTIEDVRAPLTAAQMALLDAAGAILADATAALAAAARDAAGVAGAETLLLAYLPTILDPEAPQLLRANLPLGWARPAFDVLQLEDYDWAVAERFDLQDSALTLIASRLGYPVDEQHYFGGFVLHPEQADQYRGIDRALDRAGKRGVPHRFVWALPQVLRDGYVRLPDFAEEDDMNAFDAVHFPLAPGQEAAVDIAFPARIFTGTSGHEVRSSEWRDALLHFDLAPAIRSADDAHKLIAFFRARRGPARGFLLHDRRDDRSSPPGQMVQPQDQQIGTGDGMTSRFPLIKHYGIGADGQVRRITRPRADSLCVAVDGVEIAASQYVLDDLGVVVFTQPPAAGAVITAGFLFDVPVRFASDRLELQGFSHEAEQIASVPLIEIREAQ